MNGEKNRRGRVGLATAASPGPRVAAEVVLGHLPTGGGAASASLRCTGTVWESLFVGVGHAYPARRPARP